MSGKGGGSHNNGGGKALSASIPASSRKMVQSLKEIVSNFPDHEIYATLKDCNMDPNEAVSRLLSQDPFHEVKSKREKKKETKDPTDSRARGSGMNSTSSRGGGRAGTDRHGGRGGANQFGSSDSGLQGKPVYKKENGAPAYGGYTSSASSVLGNNMNRRPPSYSDSAVTEKTYALGISDGPSSSSQLAGLQSAWMGNAGQVSMADIVKMGRPQARPSMHNSSIQGGNHQNVLMPVAASDNNLHSLQGHASKVSETNTNQGHAISDNVPWNDEWPCIENQQDVRVYADVDANANSEYYANSSSFAEADWQQKTHLDEHRAEDGSVENADNVESASISAKSTSEDDTGAEDDVSSVAANIEQLNIQRDDQGTEHEEDNPSVVIPNHLQLHTPECMNLSFGSFGSSNPLSGSASFISRPLKSNLEDPSGATDVSTIENSDARNPDYYGDEHLATTTTSDGNLVQGTGVSAGTYEHTSISQQEVLKPEPPEIAQENQYSFPSSSHGFTYENAQQPEVTFPHSQTSSQMQNLAPFSGVMAHTNTLPSALLASTVQTAREDIPYLPFPATQSMPTKYSNIASSIGGSTITMPEALRASGISTPQPNAQTLSGAGVATGPALPQHLAVHPYSQPTLPLGHFANMISYPFLHQSYTYMPSAFQQTFAGNSTYHQSLAAVLPQYKNNVSVSSLPQSAAIPSGYGFGSSTSIPGGNFSLNPPAAPTGTTIGYEDVMNSQFKDNNHMISLQQNENSPMWVQGPGSRTMSAVPPSTYYSLQGQNQQQPAGFRQRQQQQPSQHFGPLGYPNFYQSQTGISLEHQPQNPREASLGGLQSQPSKQSQQIWQNSY
ncbi:cell wall protein AWA isoform X2 [Spatholobus suberectus]|nr:cell wall protein AWA isoform X2 [Spatholobus suberectus]